MMLLKQVPVKLRDDRKCDLIGRLSIKRNFYISEAHFQKENSLLPTHEKNLLLLY